MITTLLKELREEHGLSQDATAKELGMSRPTYITLEQGKRDFTLSEAKHAAQLFGVSLEDLVRGKRVIKSSPRPKTHRRVDIRISVPQRHLKKFKQVLLYVLGKTAGKPNIGMTALYKLLYFIDFDYYEKYEEQLMGLTYMKNHHGPTPREFASVVDSMKIQGEIEELRSKYFKYDQKKFLPLKSPNLSLLSAQEIEMVDDVLARYGDKSAVELSALTHEDTPWAVAKEKEDLHYNHVFYRPDKLSVREYDPL